MTLEQLEKLDAVNEKLKLSVEAAMKQGQVTAAVALTKERIKLVSEHLKEPHILYVISRMSLVNYMWFLNGNKSKWFKCKTLPVYF